MLSATPCRVRRDEALLCDACLIPIGENEHRDVGERANCCGYTHKHARRGGPARPCAPLRRLRDLACAVWIVWRGMCGGNARCKMMLSGTAGNTARGNGFALSRKAQCGSSELFVLEPLATHVIFFESIACLGILSKHWTDSAFLHLSQLLHKLWHAGGGTDAGKWQSLH